MRSEGSVRPYRISRCCEILYFIRSAAYCQTCEQNSRLYHKYIIYTKNRYNLAFNNK